MVAQKYKKDAVGGWLLCECCVLPATLVWECKHVKGIPLCEQCKKDGYCNECPSEEDGNDRS